MLVRWSVAALLAASVLISALELSACVVSRAAAPRPAPAASIQYGLDDDALGGAPEVEGPAPATFPTLTY